MPPFLVLSLQAGGHQGHHGRKGKSRTVPYAPACAHTMPACFVAFPPCPGCVCECRQVLGLKRTVSRARGIADSMEATPAFETPSRQGRPSMPSMSHLWLLMAGRLDGDCCLQAALGKACLLESSA